MSDRKREAMFAKLAQQHAKANPEEPVAAAEAAEEDTPPPLPRSRPPALRRSPAAKRRCE